jgi:hypothetical protein
MKSGLEIRDYGRRVSAATDHATPLYPLKLVLSSPKSGVCSVGIVRSRTKATKLVGYSPFHITACFGLYRTSSGEIYTVAFKSYYASNGSIFRLYSLLFHIMLCNILQFKI